MTRVRSFDVPHKGLRNVLAKFSMLAGQTQYSDALQVDRLKALGNEMFALLKDHVHTENEYTLKPLEEKVKGASDHDMHDHELLEHSQDALEARMHALDGTQDADEGHQFYLDVTQYQSTYLEHIYHEETVTENLLQDNFTDEELISHRSQTMQRLAFPVLLLWLKYVIPAQREEERIGMLSGLKASAPQEAFETVLHTIKPELPQQEYDSLLSRL